MPYKDADKQREAVAKAARKYRAKAKGITPGITKGITEQGITEPVKPVDVIPAAKGAKAEAERIIKNAKTRDITVSQAEIDALPQALKDDINELCDSDLRIYDDRDERLRRAALYRRKFPDRAYHTPRLTKYDTAPDLAVQARLGKHTDQGNVRVARPGDAEYEGVADRMTAE